jgi:hypothetical protein
MTLTINPARTLITVTSSLLDNFIATPAAYTKITIKGYFNNTASPVTKEYTSLIPITSSTDVATNAGVETINPSFFLTTEFVQGIYQFDITLTGSTSIEQESGCLLVEEDLACQVSDYRNLDKTVQEKLMVMSDYFLLRNSQECPCKCEYLMTLYLNLLTTLENNNCQTC